MSDKQKMVGKPKRLLLKRETLKKLSQEELKRLQGGNMTDPGGGDTGSIFCSSYRTY